MTGRKLISADEAVDAKGQHTQPCSDCPWSRESLKGWLGGIDARTWLEHAHTNTLIDCHTLRGAQCAGSAIYRRNVCKRVDPPLLELPADKVQVFASPMEFLAHHTGKKGL